MTDKVQTEKPAQKTITIEADDLVVICGCRKICMIIRDGKKDLRSLDAVSRSLTEACTLACGCRVVLANISKKSTEPQPSPKGND